MLRIAVAQTPGNRLDEWPKVCELTEELIKRAASANVDVVLLPECLWPAYFIGSTDAYFAARDAGLPSDRWFLARLTTWARTHRIAICAGHVAEHDRRLHNAAILISAGGETLGRYHKCFLWDFDHVFFEAGRDITVTNTEWGPVGLMICADARLPEIPATLAARGARLILQPTAWVNVGTSKRPWNPQPELMVPERAREFGIPIASASKWGIEGQTTFVGSSLICDAGGNVLAQCGTGETDLIVSEVEPTDPQQTQLTTEQRARLLASGPARLPTPEVPPLRVALLSEGSDVRSAHKVLRRSAADGAVAPTLFLSHAPAPRSDAGSVQRGDDWLQVSGPTHEMLDLGGLRVAAVGEHDTLSFAPIRTLALEGAHVVVVFGENVSTRTLRCRAAENCVFLVHAIASRIIAYDPRGQQVGLAAGFTEAPCGVPGEDTAFELDVARAANKEVAPRTNPVTGRRPELFEL